MAEILIKAGSDTSFEVGDIITVKPDGWNWGASELDTSVFEIVKFPGEPVSKYEGYTDPFLDISIPTSISPEAAVGVLEELILNTTPTKQRRFQVVNSKIVSK